MAWAREPNVTTMRASVGDRIVVHGHGGQPNRDCKVIEVHGADGEPPYVVVWGDTGRESIFIPGPDAVLEHFHHDGRYPSTR